MNKSSRIYIAGHRGLVGSAIVRKLRSDGFENLVLSTSKELDLRLQDAVTSFFEKERPDYVFLAAAKVGGILANNTYPADFIYDNLMIQANIIHNAYLKGAKRLLFLGSSCVYPKLCPQPMKEEYLLTGALEPTNEPYAIAKITGINMCQSYNRQYGTQFVAAMPTNLYGLRDNFNLETSHALPALIRKFHLAKLLSEKRYDDIKKDLERFPVGFNLNQNIEIDLLLEELGIASEYVKIWGSGEPYREFLYVDDLADACLFLMNLPDDAFSSIITPLTSPPLINIGTGKDVAIKELAEVIKDIVGFNGEIRFDLTKPEGTPRKLLDVSRMNALGWKPATSLRHGIEKTYGWYHSIIGETNVRSEKN